ncbi:MAG: hypothetical protein SH820_08780 [Xanthomonadales bacterium]|nr:hypothetical protein [Xanthomonadales bacterium]
MITRAVITALVLSVLLSGCLLTRLYAFKQQFCDYHSNFSFSTQDEFRITLSHPLLRDKDVIWLAGAEPSQVQAEDQQKRMQWVVDKVLSAESVADPAFDQLIIAMDFVADDDDFLLQELVMDQRFVYVVSPALMDRHADNVCHSSWLVLGRSGEIDLSDADLSNQPNRQEVMDYLGQPTAATDSGPDQSPSMLFEYRLRGNNSKGRQYSFEFWHDAKSGELLRSTTTSIRFSSTTDFVKKKTWIQVK